jgi:signal transduction histidine kinase
VRSAWRLVEDLLDVSRVRGGQLRLQCERIDLRTVAAHAAQAVDFTMQQRSYRMTTSFPDAPVWVQADPARLEQVFVNLLLNAVKYTDAGGNVGLFVEREEGEAIVRIRDSGSGIDSDVLPRVFDLFVQPMELSVTCARSFSSNRASAITARSSMLFRAFGSQ